MTYGLLDNFIAVYSSEDLVEDYTRTIKEKEDQIAGLLAEGILNGFLVPVMVKLPCEVYGVLHSHFGMNKAN